MRSQQEILDKLKEIASRKLKERKEKFLSRTGENCVYNVRMRVKNNGKVGFCQHKDLTESPNKVFVCNEPDVARRCSHFCAKWTERQVEEDFDAILKSPAKCGDEYPKIAVLIWVLQEESKLPCLAKMNPLRLLRKLLGR